MKRHIPNILTLGRLVLSAVTFVALILMTAWEGGPLRLLSTLAFVSFAVASVTDFVDGYLARRWQVVSTAGAILDPIADKGLVCVAMLGLMTVGFAEVVIPGAIILVREFSVSALREVLAPRGIKLPVTFLAKTKTALQLVALGLYLLLLAYAGWAGASQMGAGVGPSLYLAARVLLWVAAAVTLWTGIEYGLAARKALRAG